jgi:subtilisin family serine protease
MRFLPLTVLVVLAASAFPAAAGASGVADEIVVMREGGLTRSELRQAGVSAERPLPIAGVELVTATGERADALDALRADPDVEWAEPNRLRRVSGDPLAGLLWGLQNTGQSVWWHRGTPDADIDAPEAWAITRGAGVTVAVVDTGADLGHQDLDGRLVGGHDFVDDDSDPADLKGHGTHVAGTIAAGENGTGVVGVAPEARVMPLRVLDATGAGSSADVAAAFSYAGDHGVPIVNASLGSSHASLAERRAIQSHPGTLYVVAAGNGGDDGVGDDNDRAAPEYPCAYDEPNVICVGASDADDARAGFSNFGATSVDLFAPGESVVSTYPRGEATYLDRYFGSGDGYEVMRGTSMATPHVAGAAALALAARPASGAAQVKAALMAGVDRPPALAGTSVSEGRLNAAAAVGVAAGAPDAPFAEQPSPAPEPAAPSAASEQPSSTPLPPPAAEPRVSRLRIAGRPRVCGRRGCQSRAAVLTFELAAEADVSVRLERRRCTRAGCRWRLAGTRSRRAPAGRTRWLVGPHLLGMPLARGAWRVTLATPAGPAGRRFTVR